MLGTEINLKKMYITVKSRGGKTITETAIWADPEVEKMLLGRGEITDVCSVQFHDNKTEASKRWRFC